MSHLVLVGPTASGKSHVAIEVAQKLSSTREIISLDSMQIYKGMEIGTGVVPFSERGGIAHHLLSYIEPTQFHTIKHFQTEVYELLDENPAKDYIFVGGTGLYTHGIVDRFSFAPTDEEVRQSVIESYNLDEKNPDDASVEKAFALLTERDPDAAEKIDPKNVRRIVRALEAIEISGTGFSETGEGIQAFGDPELDVVLVGLRYSRDVLRERITQRVKEMWAQGWAEEVRKLLPYWRKMVPPAQNAIGYKLIVEWLDGGEDPATQAELIEKIVNRTAQFSRRQRKWFERDPRITWIDCDELYTDEIIQQVYNLYLQ